MNIINQLRRFAFISLFILFQGQVVSANPISVDDLFRWPDTYSYKLSPDSQYLAKHFFRGKEYDVLEIQDVKSGRASDAYRIKVKKYAHIIEYDWIDNDTLYIYYQIGKEKFRRIILDIDYKVFQESDEEIASTHKIDSKAKIIDTLKYQNDKVLVQQYKNKQFEVFTATVEELLDDDFENALKFDKLLKSSIGYFPDEQGKVAFTATIEGKKLKFWYLKDYQSEWQILFEFGEFNFEFEPVAILDNNKMAVITNKTTDKKSLVEFDYSTKKYGKVLYQHPKYDLVDASVSKETGKVKSVTYYDHGNLKTEYFSRKSKDIDEIIRARFPNKQYIIYSQNPNHTETVLFVFAADDPGSYYWFDQSTKQFKHLGVSHSYLEKYKFTATEKFTTKLVEGFEIEAILTRPKQGNGVLLVEPHGGPVGVRNVDGFSRSNQFYASRGYSVININFRGSSGYGKKFLSEGKGQFGKRIEQDIMLAVNQVRKKYRYKKMCTMGSSYGGYSAVFLAAYHPKDFQCAIGSYGVYDLPLLFNESNIKMLDKNIKAVSATVGKYDDSLKDYSPLYFAEKITSPILIIAGKDDTVSGIEQSNRLKYRLKQLGKDFETMFYDDTGHGHENWKWDKHEHILIENYIRRKLKLGKNAKMPSKQRGDEMMRLADSFEFKDIVENDRKKAFEFYTLAAQDSHPRGLYNLASFYLNGESTEKNEKKSIELYLKASKLGYSGASFRLAVLNRKSDDLKESYKFYKLADEQGHKDAKEEVVRADCMGWGVEKDFGLCINEISNIMKEDRFGAMSIIREIVFGKMRNVDDMMSLKSLLAEYHFHKVTKNDLFEHDEFTLFEISKFGLREKDYNDDLNYNVFQKMGIFYEVNKKMISTDTYGLVKMIWTHPPFGKESPNQGETIENFLVWFGLNRRNEMFYKFDKKWKKVNGAWSLEVQSLDGETIYKESFNLNFERD